MAYAGAGVTNNPRTTWLEYFGLPDDLDEYTLSDVTSAVSSYVLPAAAAAAVGGSSGPAALAATGNPTSAAVSTSAHEKLITLADFKDYLQRVGEPYRFMAANRPRSAEDLADANGAGASDPNGDAAAPDLSTVPELCFEADFDLSKPATFAYFSPPDQPHAASLTLERLAGYLDTVELTLLSEVANRSDGFFEALKSYDVLNREVSEGCAQIEALRQRMRSLEANLVEQSLRLPTLVRRRANTAALTEKLRLVHAVWATQPTIQQLLTARDFPGALELISSSQQLLATELAGIASLRKLSASLAETKRLITSMMSKDLLQLALGYDLEAGAPAEPVEALASELDARLLPLACGLMRLNLLSEAVNSLEEQLLRDVRELVKRKLSELVSAQEEAVQAPAPAPTPVEASAGGEEGGSDSGAARAAAACSSTPAAATMAKKTKHAQVRELTVDAFECVMAGISAPLLVVLRRVALIRAALLKALATPQGRAAAAAGAAASASATAVMGGGGTNPAGPEGDEAAAAERIQHVEAQSGEMLQHVCEVAQDRYARLLKVRKELHSRLNLVDFCRMNAAVNEFVRDVNHLNPQPLSSLGAELREHAADFLRVTHEGAVRKLEALLEMEQWKQVDVAPEFQEIAECLARNQVPQQAESELMRLRADAAKLEVAEAGAARELSIEGVAFKCVGSSLLLVTTAAHYLQCVMSLQTVGGQVAHLLPALLKLFHTLTYKQVLMAGAMRQVSAGLKAITFKHLALASQSLGLVLALLPHLKAILAAYVPEAQRVVLKEMDTVSTDYEKHQQELINKFVAIVEDRRKDHVSRLGAALAPSEDRKRPEASGCIKLVAKDIVSMHKQLTPVLSRQQLHNVFVEVLGAFDGGLLAAYQGVDTSALYTRQCIVADVLFLRNEVTKLHLALPNGVCPELTSYAKTLNVKS